MHLLNRKMELVVFIGLILTMVLYEYYSKEPLNGPSNQAQSDLDSKANSLAVPKIIEAPISAFELSNKENSTESVSLLRNSIPSRENCQNAITNLKKLKKSTNERINIKLCERYLNVVDFHFKDQSSKVCLHQKDLNKLPSKACLKMVLVYRTMVEVFEGNSGNWDQLSEKSLITALEAFQENLVNNNIKKFDDFVKYMKKRSPENRMVAKAALIPLDVRSPAEMIDHIRENLDHASRLNPDDPEILGAEMLLAVATGEKGILENLEAFNAENPDSGIGHIYAAAIYHKRGQSELAKESLSQARKDESADVQRLADVGQMALSGDIDQVGVMILNGVMATVPVTSIDQVIADKAR